MDDSGVNGRAIAGRKDVSSIVKEAYRIEKATGKNIVDAVHSNLESLELFIFSSLSASKKLSNGRYRRIYHFDAKAETVEYLESPHTPILSTRQ